MKKLRIVLSVLALTLAVGVAYSSKLVMPANIVDGYEYVPTGDPQCVRHANACQDSGSVTCKLGSTSTVLKDSQTAPCGNNLFKIGS